MASGLDERYSNTMHYSFLPLIMVLTIAAAPTSTEDGLNPGKWHIAITMKADTANGATVDNPSVERQVIDGCVPDRNPAFVIDNAAMPEGCKTYQVNASRGQITFTGVCPTDEDGVSIDMSGSGTYTSERMSLRIDAHAESDGNQAAMSGTVEAMRVGACPAKRK